jgi:hypothetical protein
MRRLTSDPRIISHRALLHFRPDKTYVFYMPGMRWRNFLYAFVILGIPGLFVVAGYRNGVPGPEELLALVLLVTVISGFLSQYFANRVFLSPEELIIRKDHQHFFVRLYDIEDAFIASSLDEVDAVPLTAGHNPMEFETHDWGIVVLILRDGVLSRSTSERYDGILTKTVSFNVAKPYRFLSFLRMRI